MKKLLAMILALVMALGLCSVSWAEGNKTESDYTFPAYTDLTADSDGVYNVENEQELRTALYFAPTDGTTRTIKLTNSITLEMLYTATLFDHSNEAGTWTSNGYTSEAAEKMAQDSRCAAHKDYENGVDTLSRYKMGVHPDGGAPNQWSTSVTSQTLEQRAAYGAKKHMAAGDESIARLVVKEGQKIVLDLNGYTIAKNARATHGDWSDTSTNLIGNYGTITITDTSNTPGTLKGNGYVSCSGAVLHNFGGTMTIEKVNVNGNAEAMIRSWDGKHSGQYVIANDGFESHKNPNTNETILDKTFTGGTVIIDGANIFDTNADVDASLVVNGNGANLMLENDEAGEIIIKGNATLNHPTTKTINAKGGEVTIDSATITSNAKAISAGGGKVTVNDVTVNGSGTVETKDGGQVVINQGSFQSDVSDYVASGSQMTRNENGTYSVTKSIPSTGGYYYHPTTDTKADETKGSPKTFDAGVGIYAVTAVLSVTGMAWVGKKRH